MSAEPMYIEKVDSYLIDQFHQGLFDVTEGLWGEVMHGEWYCHLEFFKSLHSHYDQIVGLRSKSSQLRASLEHLNFSGRAGLQGGLRAEFVQSWMPIWRQRTFFLNAAYLVLKHRVDENQELGMALSMVRQILHQQILTVFSFLETDLQKSAVVPLTNHLESLIETKEKVAFLVDTMATSLQRYGFDSKEVGDWYKQRVLFRTYAMQPRFNEAFRDWGTQRSFNLLHQEIERLLALVYLESLTHKRGHSLDGLTGLPDRKSLNEEIQPWIIRWKTDQRPFVCGMLDIDHFKILNDTYGHPAGDFVLKKAADFLKSTLGSTDFAARYGGGEFVILLENLTLRQAEEKMANALSGLGDRTFEYRGNELRFTFSCGIAECAPTENEADLIARADKNLYEAKGNGRNQVSSGLRHSLAGAG